MDESFLKEFFTKSSLSPCTLSMIYFSSILSPYGSAISGVKLAENVEQRCIR